ncbi:TetR/AcrR family transcriptional regulator [Diaminobutyricibacter sp. McL0608]|uniref:TetR/AcrR family transcriptional regulator n=1 Tax=Leifsonia sp. McL0608 TaxID=3143537 RepID=UPI0031F314EB
MSSADRRRAERKTPSERAAEIEDAARAIALSGGLTTVTLRGVAAQVGVTPALVAHYQPSMESLVASTFTAVVDAELVEIAELIAASPTATERLSRLIDTLQDGSRDDLTQIWVDAWSLGRRSEVLAAAVRVQMDAWESFITDVLEGGCDSGEFTTDEPATVAWQLLGMIDGLNAQSLVHYRDAPSRGRLIAHAIEHELGLARGALTAPAPAAPARTPA